MNAARMMLATQLRRLTRLAVGAQIDDDAAASAAAHLSEVGAGWEAGNDAGPWWWGQARDDEQSVDTWSAYNPVAPPLKLSVETGAVVGSVCCGVEFGGPPGIVHGGVITLILDHALGVHLAALGRASFTASLNMSFLAPTPLHDEVEIYASHHRVDGAKTEAWAELRHAGTTTARAEALFVVGAGKWRG